MPCGNLSYTSKYWGYRVATKWRFILSVQKKYFHSACIAFDTPPTSTHVLTYLAREIGMRFVFHVWCTNLGMLHVIELKDCPLLENPGGSGRIPTAWSCAVSSITCFGEESRVKVWWRRRQETEEVENWNTISIVAHPRRRHRTGDVFLGDNCIRYNQRTVAKRANASVPVYEYNIQE